MTKAESKPLSGAEPEPSVEADHKPQGGADPKSPIGGDEKRAGAPPKAEHIVLPLLGCGLAVGWIMGISVAPTVQSTVTAILGAATAVTAILGGVQRSEAAVSRWRVTPIPVAAIAIGLAFGLTSGVYCRAHGGLEPPPSEVIRAWHMDGLEDVEVARALLALRVGGGSSEAPSAEQGGGAAGLGVAFDSSIPRDDCEVIRQAFPSNRDRPEVLRNIIRGRVDEARFDHDVPADASSDLMLGWVRASGCDVQ